MVDVLNEFEIQIAELALNFPTHFPNEFFDEIVSWGWVQKSPYSHSYYNKIKDWDTTIADTIRISDHWNFKSHGKKHCVTNEFVHNNSHWTIAMFDETILKWVPIKSIHKKETQGEIKKWN